MQLVITGFTMLVGGVTLAVAAIILLLYWQFFYKKTRASRERLDRIFFVPEKFIEDTKQTTFKFHDRKIGNMLFLLIVASIASSFLPAFLGVPDPYNAYVALIGIVITIAGLAMMSMQMTVKERDRNINTTYGSAHVIYPGIGHIGQALKQMRLEKDIELEANEHELIVDELMSYVEDMEEYKTLEKKEREGLRDRWLEKIKNTRMRRFSVVNKKYEIFIASQSDFEECKTPGTTPMIDETVPVEVQLAPMFLFYAGPAKRILKGVSDDGRVKFNDLRAGVYVDLFDLFNVKKVLTAGSFTVMTKTDALLAEALHLFEERATSATEMTNIMLELDKAKTENEKNEFDAAADANKIVNSTKQLLGILSSLLVSPSSSRTVMATTVWNVVIFLIGFGLGSLLRGFLP